MRFHPEALKGQSVVSVRSCVNWLPIDSIVKVTYWPHFLLNAYEERHKASYRGAVDFRLYKIKAVVWLRLTVDEKS